MKYAVNYFNRNTDYLDEMDEITIRYRANDTSLIAFLQKYENKRINIFIDDEKDFYDNDRINFFIALREEHPEITNYVFKLKNFKNETVQKIYDQIRSNDFKYFFETFISDWDTLTGYLALEPTDVYIVEELGFEIKQCAAAAHDRNTAIRVFPNVAQSSWKWTTGVMKFFIRPEDTPFYEPYVDVFEFFGDLSKTNTYLRIYHIDKKWYGNLNEIIIDLNMDLDSRCLLPNFASRRLDCGKRCLKGKSCKICAAEYKLADVLSQNNLTIAALNKRQQQRVEKNLDTSDESS